MVAYPEYYLVLLHSGNPGYIILSCISIAPLRSKHCISELRLRVGLIQGNFILPYHMKAEE